MNGVLVIDKPTGPTSHDVVARVRRILNERRIGHTGTLDPAASGVLPLVVGSATRLARFLTAGDKAYDAVVRLGFATDTGDAEGARLGTVHGGALPTAETIDAALSSFRGRYLQQPPAYSAKKIGGRRSYALARSAARRAAEPQSDDSAGADAAPLAAPVSVTVRALELLEVQGDRVMLRVRCSAGFYVRTLAQDLGAALGTGGHLAQLRRTASGDYTLADAVPLASIEGDRDRALAALTPLSAMLPGFSSVVLTPEGAAHALHGRDLRAADLASGRWSPADDGGTDGGTDGGPDDGADALVETAKEWVRLFTVDGELLGMARTLAAANDDAVTGGAATRSALLHPSLVLR